MDRVVNYIKGWNFMRLFQLALGVFISADGIARGDVLITTMGLFFMSMPLLNLGCFGSRSCAVPTSSQEGPEELVYEEILDKEE